MKLLTILGIVFLSIHFSYADSDSRTSRRVGLNATFNGDPAPSIAGINLNANAFSFFRVSGGIGGYSSGLANTPRAIYNYTAAPLGYAGVQIVKPLAFAFAWFVDALDQFIFHGSVKTHMRYKGFWQSKNFDRFQVPYVNQKEVFTYGGLAQVFVPGWGFSPTAGVGYAKYKALGDAFGIGEGNHSHIYYKAGFSYQSDSGFDLGFGYNFCPNLKGNACGINGSLGYFF